MGTSHQDSARRERRLIYRITPQDNVATALVELAAATAIEVEDVHENRRVVTRTTIPFGHKVAVAPIHPGEPVIKYGEVMGLATAEIAPGDHVHTHNVESQRGRGDRQRPPATS